MSKKIIKYSVTGTAMPSEKSLDHKRFNLKGFLTIQDTDVGPDYIESIISNNENHFKFTYNIIESNIRYDTGKNYDSEDIFSEGSGIINIEYHKKDYGWDNINNWQAGSIYDSMKDGNDVIFYENGTEFDFSKYDTLPKEMALHHGVTPAETGYPDMYYSIRLKLSQEIVPEPPVDITSFKK